MLEDFEKRRKSGRSSDQCLKSCRYQLTFVNRIIHILYCLVFPFKTIISDNWTLFAVACIYQSSEKKKNHFWLEETKRNLVFRTQNLKQAWNNMLVIAVILLQPAVLSISSNLASVATCYHDGHGFLVVVFAVLEMDVCNYLFASLS